MNPGDSLFVAGSGTHVGTALVRRIEKVGSTRLLGLGRDEPDVRDPAAVDRFFSSARPDHVIVAAGKQAGIAGNQRYPADLMADNLLVAASVLPAAARYAVKKLLYLASSCVYPKLAAQPMHPGVIGSGPMEPTSAAYATAKLAGIVLVDAYRRQQRSPFICAISADAYGPDDDFSAENAHVVGALVRRIHEALEQNQPAVEIWGTGTPRREFIYIDDLADACLFAMRRYDGAEPLNLGTGVTTSIAELAEAIRDVVGYRGELRFDATRPDGMPLKGLDSSSLRTLGWRPAWDLRVGIEATYRGFLSRSGREATA